MSQLRIPGESPRRISSINLDASTADTIRQIAKAEGRSRALNELLRDMVRSYVKSTHPTWEFLDETKPEKKRGHKAHP